MYSIVYGIRHENRSKMVQYGCMAVYGIESITTESEKNGRKEEIPIGINWLERLSEWVKVFHFSWHSFVRQRHCAAAVRPKWMDFYIYRNVLYYFSDFMYLYSIYSGICNVQVYSRCVPSAVWWEWIAKPFFIIIILSPFSLSSFVR